MTGPWRPPEQTPDGTTTDVATSALQKAIRAGDEQAAVYFAVQLDKLGWGNHVFKRLRIICSEDVGLAWPEGPAVIRALYDSWTEAHKASAAKGSTTKPEYTGEWLFLVHAVILLCRAPKSRLIDWTVIYHYNQTDLKVDPPDVAYDKHTDAGRKRGRRGRAGIIHFLDDGSRLSNQLDMPGEAAMKEAAARVLLAPPPPDPDDPQERLDIG